MKLILEFKNQFSLREWLSAMKQAVKELLPQLSFKEWLHAFFCYIPTAHGIRPKAGARLTQSHQILSINEHFEHLKSQGK